MDLNTAVRVLLGSIVIAVVLGVFALIRRSKGLAGAFVVAVAWCFVFDQLSGLSSNRADHRCLALHVDDIKAPLLAAREARFQRGLLLATPGYDTLSTEAQRNLRRIARAQDAQALAAGDTTLMSIRRSSGDSITAAMDSADPTPSPPPRPSDMAWYNEHCFQGHVR